MLPTAALEFELPPELIATRPVTPRDASRLLVVHRADGRVEHRVFRDLPSLLRTGDMLVMNHSWVLPARFLGVRSDTGGRLEGLYLHSTPGGQWVVMVQAGSRLMAGHKIRLLGHDRAPSDLTLVLDRREAEAWRADLREGAEEHRSHLPAADVLARVGLTPLPPYILGARRQAGEHLSDAEDRRWYQTAFADPRSKGSVAAPTAGLHFTAEVLDSLSSAGVRRTEVTLHVGSGTFRPIQADVVERHAMHEEWCRASPATIAGVEATRASGGRIIPVGTTSVRTLESLPDPLTPGVRRDGFAGQTRLLITPGHSFRWTDGLVTNFHLPRSTLLALVAAMMPGGVEQLLGVYRQAIAERYRFYSYGDAMLIL